MDQNSRYIVAISQETSPCHEDGSDMRRPEWSFIDMTKNQTSPNIGILQHSKSTS